MTPRSQSDHGLSRRAFLLGGLTTVGGVAVGGFAITRLRSQLSPADTTPAAERTWKPGAAPNPIPEENARAGTDAWGLTGPTDGSIGGYTDAITIGQGQPLTFYVSTAAPTFTVDVYRMGWYGGKGARLVDTREVKGKTQAKAVLTDDPSSYMIEAPWKPSFELATGPDWVSGVYLARLTASTGGQSYVPFVVTDGRPATFLAQSAVTTWLAYNLWGGRGIYRVLEGKNANDPAYRSRVVSFDRPFDGMGAKRFLQYEYPLVRFLERHGRDVTYSTNLDTHAGGLLDHSAVLSMGHDEYWTSEMRANLDDARDAGVNLAFFSANDGYRKIRFEDSPVGKNRRMVHYREYLEDPLLGIDNDRVASHWRWGPTDRPENSLLGIMYEADPVNADWVVADIDHQLLEGTKLKAGSTVPGLVGHEYDRAFLDGAFARYTPGGLSILARSPVRVAGKDAEAHTSHYTAASGAGVFCAGSMQFAWGLDDYAASWRLDARPFENTATRPAAADARLQRFTTNILDAFSDGPAGFLEA